MNAIERLRKCFERPAVYPEDVIHNMRSEFGAENLLTTRDVWLAVIDEMERELEERYMELPLDRDGKPVHVGDTMMDYETQRDVVAVTDDCVVLGSYSWDGEQMYRCGFARDYSHYVKPTVESVLEKALNEVASFTKDMGHQPSAEDITNIVNQVAPKLQLREE